jgi:hypothetical protein
VSAPAAAEAARRGWHVFPCRRDGDIGKDGQPAAKRPAVDDWENRACSDPEKVARYWPSPRHNVGIACGPSGLVVIDLDTHGTLPDDWHLPGIRDGRDVLAQLCEWAGQPWPATYMVATPSGGWHLYYLAPDGREIRTSAGKLGPLVDVRACGGYVVGEGSVVGGTAYRLLDSQPPVPLPGWLARLMLPPQDHSSPRPPATGSGSARLAGLAETVRRSQPGDRTGPLVWAAHRLQEMVAAGDAALADAELLVQAAVAAGIRGGESYARGQVRHVLGGDW